MIEVEGYEEGMYEKGKKGEREVALKDYWLDDGSNTEKAVLCDIFERLEKVKDDETALNWADTSHRQLFQDLLNTGGYKQYFMGIEVDMRLSTTKSRLSSATLVPDFLTPLETSSSNAGSESTQVTQSQPVEAVRDIRKSPFPREYRTKLHCRLIYEDVGRPLHAAVNLRSTFEALNDILIGTFAAFLRGLL